MVILFVFGLNLGSKIQKTIMWHLLATTKTWTRELVTLLTMICVLGRLMKWLPISTKMMLNNFIPFLFSTLWLVINLFENLQEMVIILCSAHHNIMENMLDNSNFFFFLIKAIGCFSGNYKLLTISRTSFGDCFKASSPLGLISARNMSFAL